MINRLKSFLAGLIVFAAVLCAMPDVRAQAIVSTGESFVSARLLPGLREDDGARLIGLRLVLAPGWKTYWRTPGDAGIPPHFDWSASDNIQSVQVMWPRPEVFKSFGYQTIGYSERVVLPIRVLPVDPAQPISIQMTADLGVCKELCVLEQVTLVEDISPDLPEIGAREVRRAYRAVPPVGVSSGLTAMECRISGTGADRRFDAALTFATPVVAPVVIAEGGETMWISDTATKVAGSRIDVSGKIGLPEDTAWIDRDALRLTVLADGFSADIRGCRNHAG